jgi:hypothetical protein
MFWFDVQFLRVREVVVLEASASGTREDLKRVRDAGMPDAHYYVVSEGWLKGTPADAINARLGDLSDMRVRKTTEIELLKLWLQRADKLLSGCLESSD